MRVIDAPFAEAFFVLNESRTYRALGSMGDSMPNPVSLVEISAYFSIRGIASALDKSKYLHLIQLLDRTFLTHMASK